MSDLQTLVAQGAAKQPATFTADVAVKKVLNYLKSSGGGGLPLGHLFAWPFQTPPDGAIQCNGAEYNRALYADFFAHASSKGWVKTETEWQSIASQNNGYCSYYSDGDGSTTFRTPKFAPFMQVAIASGNVGSYHEAGLPNITGAFDHFTPTTDPLYVRGAFSKATGELWDWTGASEMRRNKTRILFNSQSSSSIYGSSTTVQPESHEWMICVVVFGIATNVGSADVGNVMSAVAQVQAELPNKLSNTTQHIVDTWKSGESWYRKWSDGWIEQGGEVKSKASQIKVSLHVPMKDAAYSIFLTSGDSDNDQDGAANTDTVLSRFKTATSFNISHYATLTSVYWIAKGY